MTGKEKAGPKTRPIHCCAIREAEYITKRDIESTNQPVAIYRIRRDNIDYYPVVLASICLAVEGFTDDLPYVLAEYPGAPVITKQTIDQLCERVRRAVDEMVQGSIGDVRVSFPTMRGIASYGMHRRPVAADSAKDSLLTIHVNHKGELTERYGRPSLENMAVKREISDYGQGGEHAQ